MLLTYLLVSGVTSGAMYALVAVGLVICYRTTGHLNFSHGEMYMVGGYFAFTFHVLWGCRTFPPCCLRSSPVPHSDC